MPDPLSNDTDQVKQLEAFLKKKGLPPEFLKILTDFGVSSLSQLKAVKDDPQDRKKLREKLSKITQGGSLFDQLSVAEIKREIDASSTPVAPEVEQRKKTFDQAIEEAKKDLKEVKETSDKDLEKVRNRVAAAHDKNVQKIKDACGAEFTAATEAAAKSKSDLVALLDRFIVEAGHAKDILDAVEKTPRSIAEIIHDQQMLCGYFVNPAGIQRFNAELIRMPEQLDHLLKDPGELKSVTITYKGMQATSVASASVRETGFELAGALEVSAAGYVGSGVGAVSVVASAADATTKSDAEERFETSQKAQCGELRYVYAPQKSLVFNRFDLRFSDVARKEIEEIKVIEKPEDRAKRIREFYQTFGTHFFLKYFLGGRYRFTATGKSASKDSKGRLEAAVTETMDWAVGVSGSYAGLGGAAKAAANVQGATREAVAKAEGYTLHFEEASVSVETEVLGGTLAPRDVWQQSLRYNSVWEAIKREDPLSVWEIMRQDKEDEDFSTLASQFEEVWVRDVFCGTALWKVSPDVYDFIKKSEIRTCAQLKQIMEPDHLEVVIVESKPSAEVSHPRNSASSKKRGCKLIGGGARVDWKEPGNLLTGSYPEGNSWVVSSKDHLFDSPAKITAYAIYLYDPLDQWDVKCVTRKTAEPSNRPEATARLPEGYQYTGGGALVEGAAEAGLLLTASKPNLDGQKITGWIARGKDHLKADRGHATAWAIGIKPKTGTMQVVPSVLEAVSQDHEPQGVSPGGDGEVVVGGGAEVTWKGRKGGALTALHPASDGTAWHSAAKYHGELDDLTLVTYAIAVTGKIKA